MAYPKNKISRFITDSDDYIIHQINLHVGNKYAYWFIQNHTPEPFKLPKGVLPPPLEKFRNTKIIQELLLFSKS